MKYLGPLILLAGLVLAGCTEEPLEVVESKKPVVMKAEVDTVLLCSLKPTDSTELSGEVAPIFSLRNDRTCMSVCQVEFQDADTHWCYWGNQFDKGKSVSFNLEAGNAQASGIEELLLWRVRQGAEIKRVIEDSPDMKISNQHGVFRATLILRDLGSPIMVIDGLRYINVVTKNEIYTQDKRSNAVFLICPLRSCVYESKKEGSVPLVNRLAAFETVGQEGYKRICVVLVVFVSATHEKRKRYYANTSGVTMSLVNKQLSNLQITMTWTDVLSVESLIHTPVPASSIFHVPYTWLLTQHTLENAKKTQAGVLWLLVILKSKKIFCGHLRKQKQQVSTHGCERRSRDLGIPSSQLQEMAFLALKQLFMVFPIALTRSLHNTNSETFHRRLTQYIEKYRDFLNEKTIHPFTDEWSYTHENLRGALHRLVRHERFLFSFEQNKHISKTTNSLEGYFAHVKRYLGVHTGLSRQNKQRVLNTILLASTVSPNKKRLDEVL